ncbi:glycosyltransferase family 2 protein [Pseudorhodobacter turbinis]|uniref:Glycosyltransferase family 2 protein n=1 Tax=Pseudorhodobacter turbinis TaxID=2500533 RepID=A0A4V1E0X1_9RHOB|nr:glycosyltransferase family 2 protein [Pseudorhodobacter turbinis]
MLSIILPASNEASYIGPCLEALLASTPVPGGAEVIVVANGCRDDTAARAGTYAAQAEAAGWGFTVLDLAQGGKIRALNAGDAQARGDMRAYLDADVIVSPDLMAQIAQALAGEAARYASGRAVIPRAQSAVTRAYARFWQTLPFAQSDAPGYGLFAVNAAGRARWGEFPDLISDDTFVRLQFGPDERVSCAATYRWPMIEGFESLVRVRRRQDQGVAQIASLHPEILEREAKPKMGLRGVLQRAGADPLGFAVYAAVSLAVRLRRGGGEWARGR